MEFQEHLYPSEVARLVLGYLKDMNCSYSCDIFLIECPHLHEHYTHLKAGKAHPTNVNGKSLMQILEEFCTIKSSQRGSIHTEDELELHNYTDIHITEVSGAKVNSLLKETQSVSVQTDLKASSVGRNRRHRKSIKDPPNCRNKTSPEDSPRSNSPAVGDLLQIFRMPSEVVHKMVQTEPVLSGESSTQTDDAYQQRHSSLLISTAAQSESNHTLLLNHEELIYDTSMGINRTFNRNTQPHDFSSELLQSVENKNFLTTSKVVATRQITRSITSTHKDIRKRKYCNPLKKNAEIDSKLFERVRIYEKLMKQGFKTNNLAVMEEIFTFEPLAERLADYVNKVLFIKTNPKLSSISQSHENMCEIIQEMLNLCMADHALYENLYFLNNAVFLHGIKTFVKNNTHGTKRNKLSSIQSQNNNLESSCIMINDAELLTNNVEEITSENAKSADYSLNCSANDIMGEFEDTETNFCNQYQKETMDISSTKSTISLDNLTAEVEAKMDQLPEAVEMKIIPSTSLSNVNITPSPNLLANNASDLLSQETNENLSQFSQSQTNVKTVPTDIPFQTGNSLLPNASFNSVPFITDPNSSNSCFFQQPANGLCQNSTSLLSYEPGNSGMTTFLIPNMLGQTAMPYTLILNPNLTMGPLSMANNVSQNSTVNSLLRPIAIRPDTAMSSVPENKKMQSADVPPTYEYADLVIDLDAEKKMPKSTANVLEDKNIEDLNLPESTQQEINKDNKTKKSNRSKKRKLRPLFPHLLEKCINEKCDNTNLKKPKSTKENKTKKNVKSNKRKMGSLFPDLLKKCINETFTYNDLEMDSVTLHSQITNNSDTVYNFNNPADSDLVETCFLYQPPLVSEVPNNVELSSEVSCRRTSSRLRKKPNNNVNRRKQNMELKEKEKDVSIQETDVAIGTYLNNSCLQNIPLTSLADAFSDTHNAEVMLSQQNSPSSNFSNCSPVKMQRNVSFGNDSLESLTEIPCTLEDTSSISTNLDLVSDKQNVVYGSIDKASVITKNFSINETEFIEESSQNPNADLKSNLKLQFPLKEVSVVLERLNLSALSENVNFTDVQHINKQSANVIPSGHPIGSLDLSFANVEKKFHGISIPLKKRKISENFLSDNGVCENKITIKEKPIFDSTAVTTNQVYDVNCHAIILNDVTDEQNLAIEDNLISNNYSKKIESVVLRQDSGCETLSTKIINRGDHSSKKIKNYTFVGLDETNSCTVRKNTRKNCSKTKSASNKNVLSNLPKKPIAPKSQRKSKSKLKTSNSSIISTSDKNVFSQTKSNELSIDIVNSNSLPEDKVQVDVIEKTKSNNFPELFSMESKNIISSIVQKQTKTLPKSIAGGYCESNLITQAGPSLSECEMEDCRSLCIKKELLDIASTCSDEKTFSGPNFQNFELSGYKIKLKKVKEKSLQIFNTEPVDLSAKKSMQWNPTLSVNNSELCSDNFFEKIPKEKSSSLHIKSSKTKHGREKSLQIKNPTLLNRRSSKKNSIKARPLETKNKNTNSVKRYIKKSKNKLEEFTSDLKQSRFQVNPTPLQMNETKVVPIRNCDNPDRLCLNNKIADPPSDLSCDEPNELEQAIAFLVCQEASLRSNRTPDSSFIEALQSDQSYFVDSKESFSASRGREMEPTASEQRNINGYENQPIRKYTWQYREKRTNIKSVV